MVGHGQMRGSANNMWITTMTICTSSLVALAFAAAITSVSLVTYAQTSPPTDAHHPAESGQSKPSTPAPNQLPSQSGSSMGMMGGQSGGGMMMGGDMGPMMLMMHGRGMMGGMPFQHVEGRLAFLKTELKITPAQQPQWDKFAEAFRSVAKNAQSMMQQMMQGGGSAHPAKAPDLFARYETMLTTRLDAVRSVKSVFDPLYATLNEEQRKIADEVFASPMGMM
jgi:predicted lipid-binding transport protein (Tim44 family)